MSTAAQQLAAIEAAVREACEQDFPVNVDYSDFDDARATPSVDRDGSDVVVGLDVVLVRVESDVMTYRESHRFPLANDPEAIARAVLARLEEIHDAAHSSDGVNLPGDVKQLRVQRLAGRVVRGDAGAMLELAAACRRDPK